ncbi:S1 family peptidase [Herbidospora daliensis]|uniref:S1 family peptidase n=1 Tax=Herbidospora daliensis TaxID=295585 RepID=UPI000AC088BD|nr:trypsin-like serine protease [Herbidospora daliensis]
MLLMSGRALAQPDPGPEQSIVGGTVSPWSAYPYVVRLSNGCTATLISPTAVLTAQHCVDGYGPLSAHFSNGGSSPSPVYSAMPGFDPDEPWVYDLAILSVDPAATVGVTPVQVGSPWNPQIYRPGVPATIAGIGATAPSGAGSGVLRAADVPILSDDAMDDVYNPWYWFDDWIEHLMIGAGGSARTTCSGDSGGPLAVWDHARGRVVQVGVTSWGHEDCNRPTAFMELAGPNLAWLASMQPSVMYAWGPCTTPAGETGVPDVGWGQTYAGGPSENGIPWRLRCVAPPTGPLPPAPVPDPEDDPPPPPDCHWNLNGGKPVSAPSARHCPD